MKLHVENLFMDPMRRDLGKPSVAVEKYSAALERYEGGVLTEAAKRLTSLCAGRNWPTPEQCAETCRSIVRNSGDRK